MVVTEQQGAMYVLHDDFDTALAIPVIDLGDGNLQEEESSNQIRVTCARWGIFQMLNHGVREVVFWVL